MTTKTLEPTKTTCATGPCAESSPARVAKRTHGPVATPRADVWETAEAAHLAIELPGIRPDDLDLRIESDRLTVRATPAEAAADGTTLAAEWRPRTYERTFLLTDDADRGAIEAHLRHGLLLVTVPRRAERRPRSIPVRVAAD